MSRFAQAVPSVLASSLEILNLDHCQDLPRPLIDDYQVGSVGVWFKTVACQHVARENLGRFSLRSEIVRRSSLPKDGQMTYLRDGRTAVTSERIEGHRIAGGLLKRLGHAQPNGEFKAPPH